MKITDEDGDYAEVYTRETEDDHFCVSIRIVSGADIAALILSPEQARKLARVLEDKALQAENTKSDPW